MGNRNASLAMERGRLSISSLRNASVEGILTVSFVMDAGIIFKRPQSCVKNVTARAGYPVLPAVAMERGTSSNEFPTFGGGSTRIRTMGETLKEGSHWKSRLRLGIELLALIAFIAVGGVVILSRGLPPSSSGEEKLTEASYYIELDGKRVQCQLCPRQCIIGEGRRGTCQIRENRGGKLYTLSYGKVCALNIDPIEKLPLYHVQPGSPRLNLATAGCNLECRNCQNWQISQRTPEEVESLYLTPEEVVKKALVEGVNFISFTYTEPTIFYEYMFDICKLAKPAGLKTLLNTNGSINPEPLRELLQYLDAVNIDLKGFTPEFYQENCSGELEPVLRSLKLVKEEGVHLEIVNLVIPTLNDDMEKVKEMCVWIKDNLGTDVPLHFTRFFPAYRLTKLPPTPVETLERARNIALEVGLEYVYIGNVPGHPANNTFCPRCGEKLLSRIGLILTENNLQQGRCPFCGYEIPGVWE